MAKPDATGAGGPGKAKTGAEKPASDAGARKTAITSAGSSAGSRKKPGTGRRSSGHAGVGETQLDKAGGLVSASWCGGCYHYSCESPEIANCDFIGHTGHCRPCRAGEGCTEYITEKDWRKRDEYHFPEFNEYLGESKC